MHSRWLSVANNCNCFKNKYAKIKSFGTAFATKIYWINQFPTYSNAELSIKQFIVSDQFDWCNRCCQIRLSLSNQHHFSYCKRNWINENGASSTTNRVQTALSTYGCLFHLNVCIKSKTFRLYLDWLEPCAQSVRNSSRLNMCVIFGGWSKVDKRRKLSWNLFCLYHFCVPMTMYAWQRNRTHFLSLTQHAF